MGKFNYFDLGRKRIEKLSIPEQADLIFDLINAFSLMRTPTDSALLLQDLLTEKEMMNLSKRLRIAKLLLDNKTQYEIVEQLHCSFATVSKVNLWLNNAGQGLKKVIKKLPERNKASLPRKTPGVGYGLPEILAHYLSSSLEKNEKKQLEKILENLRSKDADDKDFREEVNDSFRKS